MTKEKDIKNGEIMYGTSYSGMPWENCEDVKFYLEHSCGDWIIGDIKQAKKFLSDLEKTIKEVEEKQ